MLDRNYSYSEKLSPHRVLVTLDDRANYFETLEADLSDYGKRYGFRFRSAHYATPQLEGPQLSHLILVADLKNTPSFWASLEADLGMISELYSSATICISYFEASDFHKASPVIDKWKEKFGSSINFLRPDDSVEPIKPNYIKILDNAVCDTVRVKYDAQRESLSFECPDQVQNFFANCSTLYEDQALYHRASTDGFFCCRHEGKIYITSTRTNKLNLDPSRVTQIHRYNEADNEIFYSGPFLPSSDSVEACILLSRIPSLTAILHTHASSKITRNPKMKEHILVPPLPYGEAELGHRIADAIIARGCDWGILEDHGEVFTTQLPDLKAAFEEINHCVKEAINDGR